MAMPLLFFGFFVAMVAWLFIAVAWALALLFWPVTLLIAGALVWRAQSRFLPRLVPARAGGVRSGPSHNSAFDDYRRETVARLDEESSRFREFLDRLRRSRDHQEFRAFMEARRGRNALTRGDFPAA
jgi:predicted membrane metal-binding protein